MEPTIEKLLCANLTEGEVKTHVSMGNYKGSYLFNTKTQNKLFDVYSKSITSGVVPSLAELPHPSGCIPVLIDMDIKKKIKQNNEENTQNPTRLYTDEHVSKVIEIYQNVLRNIVDECSDNHLLCVVLEKPPYKDGGNTASSSSAVFLKSGFHLHFPFCFMNASEQISHLLPRVNEALTSMNVFGDIICDDITPRLDDGYCKSAWLMYGSSKGVGKAPYKVSRVISASGEIIPMETAFKNYKIYDDIGNLIKITKENVEYHLPRILSILPFPSNKREKTNLKKGLLSYIKEQIKNNPERKARQQRTTTEADLRNAKDILPLISDHRAELFDDWLDIGFTLFCISKGSDEGLDLWCDFSERCPDKYNKDDCISRWNNMYDGGKTIAGLSFYAKLDNPLEYKQYMEKRMKKQLDESIGLSGTNYDLAKVLYEEYNDEFICASPEGTVGVWYKFHNHRWEENKQATDLYLILSEHVYDLYKNAYEKEREKEKGEENEKTSAKVKQIRKIMSNLKTNSFKTNVIKEGKNLFRFYDLSKKLDSNKNLIGFKNGVYNLNTNTFRDGIPSDYISKCTNINYVEFSEDDDRVIFVNRFLEQVFPNKNIRTYFLDMFSDVFKGGNEKKHVYFWTGSGDNAKSILLKIFELMLGDYQTKLPTGDISGKQISAGAANASFARTKNVRWLVVDEVEKKEPINSATLKRISGNDSIMARDLFEKGKDTKEFTPMFKVCIVCNDLPEVPFHDKAVWNRIKVINFESKFVEEGYPATYEEQLEKKIFPVDRNFDLKIEGMLEPFAWVLLNHRKKCTRKMEPPEVRAATEMYRKNNDLFRQFLDDTVVITDDVKDTITLSDIYGKFKMWFRESMPGKVVPVKDEAKKYMSLLLKGDKKGMVFTGVAFKGEDEKEENGFSLLPKM